MLVLLGEVIIAQISFTEIGYMVVIERLGEVNYQYFETLDQAVDSIKALLPENCAKELTLRR